MIADAYDCIYCRYMFASTEKARLQEIGPRFTLKLRWLRKGLPSVLAADGVAPRSGEKAEVDDDDDDIEADENAGEGDVDMDENMERTDKPTEGGEGDEDEDDDEEEEEGDKKVKKSKGEVNGVKIPALDEQQEYEWKWKVSSALIAGFRNAANDSLCRAISQRWKFPEEHSSCSMLAAHCIGCSCIAIFIYPLYHVS